ncbi:unnamed protein product [Urochloa decumbens]|uniref:DUF4220 domain-containing protein n=1 Tax=Urochloa decumbens TaxID=240449 RepID=A0ABC9BDE8_9POAL
MAEVLRLWNKWEIQILVLVSFALQVLLLFFAWMRRRSISRALRILLWLMYLLAEYTTTYTLGHMSIGCKPGERQQLMAFWAPFLLVHLGGQDTITAYAMEDNQLWLRHLLTFAVQALGAAYVLYKNIGSRGPLVAPAVLMYLVGVLKNGERVWALGFSRLEIIRRYLDGISIKQKDEPYPKQKKVRYSKQMEKPEQKKEHYSKREEEPYPDQNEQPVMSLSCESCLTSITPSKLRRPILRKRKSVTLNREQAKPEAWDCWLGKAAFPGCKPNRLDKRYSAGTQLDDELVLQGAHDLLYICMGQFVDDRIWPSVFQSDAIKYFHDNNKTFELIEMQLSLMYDIFYTKAAVIHTWYGRCFRAISLLGTSMSFFLFQFSTGKEGYNRVDAAVTYILVIGALILEAASVLRSMGSTWTCAMLKVMKWDWLHSLHVSFRRYVGVAQTRRWSGSTGQLNLLDSYTGDTMVSYTGDITRLGSRMISFCKNGSSMISTGAKELVLNEILRIAEACEGKEDMMWSYRGQCALKRPDECLKDGLPDGFLKDLTWSTGTEFDQSILAWHLATDKFLKYSKSTNAGPLVEATKAISNYMTFLLVERPYMLPSPVRPTLHLKARQELLAGPHGWFMEPESHNYTAEVLTPGAKLANELLIKESQMLHIKRVENYSMPDEPPKLELLRVIFGVWVEMLCYAAHHCSRESHARQLSNGGEFITIVWLLTTAEFDRIYCSESRFKERKPGSIWNFVNFVNFTDFMKYVKSILRFLQKLILNPCLVIYFCMYFISFCIFSHYFCHSG